jgi:predicted phosphodiesterase
MKTIIISDLHNRFEWVEDALLSPLLQPYDNVIFLGDYFDDYNDTPEMVANAATWLKYSIRKPNRIHLTGTHDLWYRFPHNRFITVSGNTEAKAYAIRSILTQEDWNKLYLYYYEQNYLMTHAGVHPYLISEYVSRNRNIFDKYIVNNNLQLDSQNIINRIVGPATEDALDTISEGFADPWLNAGFARGGSQPVGGIIWLDWRYEFKPIPGLNQIVGHTELNIPDKKYIKSSINYDLDTRNQHIGILENGEFRHIETIDVLESI